MDDLITRQAAIDALEERLKANGYSNVALVSELNRSIEYLMQLPSAQPEIIRCRECKYRTQGVGGFYMCNRLWDQFIDDDFFCADGERRSENERSD